MLSSAAAEDRAARQTLSNLTRLYPFIKKGNQSRICSLLILKVLGSLSSFALKLLNLGLFGSDQLQSLGAIRRHDSALVFANSQDLCAQRHERFYALLR